MNEFGTTTVTITIHTIEEEPTIFIGKAHTEDLARSVAIIDALLYIYSTFTPELPIPEFQSQLLFYTLRRYSKLSTILRHSGGWNYQNALPMLRLKNEFFSEQTFVNETFIYKTYSFPLRISGQNQNFYSNFSS